MSQIPPPPPVFQSQQSYSVPAKASNGWGITSLVIGIVGFCIPFVGGLLATVFGIVGIAKSRKRGGGAGLSIAGLVLGIISLLVWVVFGSALFAALGMTQANRNIASQFIKDLHAGNIQAAQTATDGTLTKDELDTLSQDLKASGALTDVTTFNTSVVNATAHLDGLISFGPTKETFSMEQVKSAGAWKVKSISLTPVSGSFAPAKTVAPPTSTTEESAPQLPTSEPAPAGQ